MCVDRAIFRSDKLVRLAIYYRHVGQIPSKLFVTSRLDYCNSLLFGCSKYVINKLQLVQNTAAIVITRSPRFEHITPTLKKLHWLPVSCRIEYKLLTLEMYTPTRLLRSQQDATLLVVPKTNINCHIWGPFFCIHITSFVELFACKRERLCNTSDV